MHAANRLRTLRLLARFWKGRNTIGMESNSFYVDVQVQVSAYNGNSINLDHTILRNRLCDPVLVRHTLIVESNLKIVSSPPSAQQQDSTKFLRIWTVMHRAEER